MNFSNPYSTSSDVRVAALLDVSERTTFIRRTYLHLGVAVIAFVLLEALLMNLFPAEVIGRLMQRGGAFIGLVFLFGFVAVSWLARSWASSGSSSSLQYAGLGLYVVAEAAIFLPLMAIASAIDPTIPLNAGIITGTVFGGLTFMTFMTGANFSWLGRYLFLASLGMLGVMICGMFFGGFTLGLWFSVIMVVLAAGYILYDTSNIMHQYRTDQHVAAALALFASVALLLMYVVRLLIQMRDE